jgi:hypothetical protein
MKADQNGMMEYWSVAEKPSFHSSIIPAIQYSRERSEFS